MSHKNITKAVVKYLERKGFRYVKCLGEGGYGSVLKMITPDKKEVAVKVVEKSKIWIVEDKYWPILKHPNILEVTNTESIDELNVQLYFMPILPKDLFDELHSKKFKKDPNSFYRVKKWFRQILIAIEHLHSCGFCHLDLKTDNVLLDVEDNATLIDFSGLNFTFFPVDRQVAPKMFWPKECFPTEGEIKIEGKPFDMWSFGLLALNVLTDHYPLIELGKIMKCKPDFDEEILPILKNVLRKARFSHLMRRAFPNADLSDSDINEALHFLRFVLKVEPRKRPDTRKVKMHPFLKIDSNPFLKELNEHLRKKTNDVNPFENKIVDENDVRDSTLDDARNVQNSNTPRRNKFNWFKKQFNRLFKKKN